MTKNKPTHKSDLLTAAKDILLLLPIADEPGVSIGESCFPGSALDAGAAASASMLDDGIAVLRAAIARAEEVRP